MRIGCLQFAPQVGGIDNNLNRADAVLNRCQDLEDLDLLVLPELAFTGYNFHSLAHISPYLEPSGSGISSLWARTTALKFNCNVVVGYPEKVDVTEKWPASPEFYNSAIVVGRDGETIANYRKSFLYTVDETWALEGRNGFFDAVIPDLGSVAMGICMDINPYKFEAPWHAFEFAFHVLEVQANLVILTMAWVTRESAPVFTQYPQEPDLDTLEYWIQRLEPVIRSGNEEEIIFVVCNRTGIEEDTVYAGTSAVFGVRDGEVNLYGILGRGVKKVLVVDTASKPFAKIVSGTSGEDMEAGNEFQQPSGQASNHLADMDTGALPCMPESPVEANYHAENLNTEKMPAPNKTSAAEGENTSATVVQLPLSPCSQPPTEQPSSKLLLSKLGLQIPEYENENEGLPTLNGPSIVSASPPPRVPAEEFYNLSIPPYLSKICGVNAGKRMDFPITSPTRSWKIPVKHTPPAVTRRTLPSPSYDQDFHVRGCTPIDAVLSNSYRADIPVWDTPPASSGFGETDFARADPEKQQTVDISVGWDAGENGGMLWASRLKRLSNVVEEGKEGLIEIEDLHLRPASTKSCNVSCLRDQGGNAHHRSCSQP